MSVKNDITPNGNEMQGYTHYATVQNSKMRHQVDNFIAVFFFNLVYHAG